MRFIKRMYLSNFAFLLLPLLLITITVYIVGADVISTQMHERNQLFLENLVQSSQHAMNDLARGEKYYRLDTVHLSDGIACIVNRTHTVISETGITSATDLAKFPQFIANVNWSKIAQGQRHIFANQKYYLYYQPLEDGLVFLYFRLKNIATVSLDKFRRALLLAFLCLLLLFIYIEKNFLKQLFHPLEELTGMVRRFSATDNNAAVLSPARPVSDDEIVIIRNYLEELQENVRERDSKLRRNLFSVMDVLIGLLEIKDSYTASHSKQVRKYSIAIAQMLGLAENEIRDIAFAATLHDIGKIGVSRTILNKPGKLTPQEFALIKQHPVVADEVLKNIEELNYIRKIIRHHHERFDGTGYPDGLSGEEIMLASRIVSVADSFDAMTSDRPYRKALDYRVAIDILVNEKGKQFDPKVVDALVKYIYRQNMYQDQVAAGKE